MHNLRKLLIIVAVLCASFAFSLVSASAAEEIDVFQFRDLIQAVNKEGDVDIKLKYDIVFEWPITIEHSGTKTFYNETGKEIAIFDVAAYITRAFNVTADNVTLNFNNAVKISGDKFNRDYQDDAQGIYVSGYKCTIQNCSFEYIGSTRLTYDGDNWWYDWSGGAIFVDNEECTIEGCTFLHCSAQNKGGAICVYDKNCYINNCYFESCDAVYSGYGGCVYVCNWCSGVEIFNCEFINYNTPDPYGDYVYGDGDTKVFAYKTNKFADNCFYDCELVTEKQEISNGYYRIHTALNDDLRLDILGGSAAQSNGDNLQLWDSSSTSDVFYIERDDKYNAYKITAVHSGKVLDIEGESIEPEANIYQYDDWGGPNQRWVFEKVGDNGLVYIQAVKGLFMDVAYAGANTGANVWSYTFNDSQAQKFRLELLENYNPLAGSMLSQGSLWTIIGIAVAAIAAVGVVVTKNKHKKAI